MGITCRSMIVEYRRYYHNTGGVFSAECSVIALNQSVLSDSTELCLVDGLHPQDGTGSTPPGLPGWHRKIRLIANQLPHKTPCCCTASSE